MPRHDWPFVRDADRDDPLTALRIAVTSSHPQWRYLVAFDRESEARPTDAEALMLASYLDHYKQRWYNASYLSKLARRPLDVDSGANGVVFHKFGPDDWGYRRQSYERGWPWSVVWPALRALDEHRHVKNGGPFSLSALMDRIRQCGLSEPNADWQKWKAAHPGVFGASERVEA
jgi:hypothetical protein